MNTITMICWKRPDYLTKALFALGRNDLAGFDAVHIFAEPNGGAEMRALLDSFDEGDYVFPIPILVHHNGERLGVDKNGYQALSFAFDIENADLNMHIEEDVVVSRDAARMALNYSVMPPADDRLCLCFHNHNGKPPADATDTLLNALQAINEFNPYGWACTKGEWERWFKREWFTNRWSPDGIERYGWDWSINYHAANTKEVYTVMPMVSRATTIGEFGGANMTPEQWRAEFAGHVML